MPLARYGVLAGRVVDRRAEGGTDTPHYQIQVDGGGVDFRVAVNVLSKQHPSELLYLADESFQHPVVQELATRPDGFTPLPSTPGGLALDFIRANLFDRTKLRAVPATARGPTTTWPTSSTTSWRGPRPTRRQGSTPSASGGGPNRAHATRCSGSHPATGSTTSTCTRATASSSAVTTGSGRTAA
jgi:hypothetical protein